MKEEALSTNGFEDKGMNGWMVKALPSFEVSSFIFLACLATCFVGKKYLVDLVWICFLSKPMERERKCYAGLGWIDG